MRAGERQQQLDSFLLGGLESDIVDMATSQRLADACLQHVCSVFKR